MALPRRIEDRFFGDAAIVKVDEGGERSAAHFRENCLDDEIAAAAAQRCRRTAAALFAQIDAVRRDRQDRGETVTAAHAEGAHRKRPGRDRRRYAAGRPS